MIYKPILRDKELLYTEYVVNKKSVSIIAEEYGSDKKRIRKALVKYSIQKRCNYCGNTDNLVTDKLGRTYDYCYDCQKILAGNGGNKYWQSISKEEKQMHIDKIHQGCKDYYKNLSEEKRQWHSVLSKETAINTWNSSTDKEKQERINKIKQTKENTSIEILEDRYKRIGDSNKGKKSAMRGKGYFKCWVEKYGLKKAQELEDGRIQNILKTNKEKGIIKISKIEQECFNYIKENIDPFIQSQIKYNKWYIDFYLPSHDLYIEFNGEYWHGYVVSKEKLLNSDRGKAILKKMESDKEKLKTIKNLIIIREKDFKKDPKYLNSLILERSNTFKEI